MFPEETRGGDVKAKGKKLPFEDFAKQSFKVNHLYAKQALAIANYSPELQKPTRPPQHSATTGRFSSRSDLQSQEEGGWRSRAGKAGSK
jgi:hypothetical protein